MTTSSTSPSLHEASGAPCRWSFTTEWASNTPDSLWSFRWNLIRPPPTKKISRSVTAPRQGGGVLTWAQAALPIRHEKELTAAGLGAMRAV